MLLRSLSCMEIVGVPDSRDVRGTTGPISMMVVIRHKNRRVYRGCEGWLKVSQSWHKTCIVYIAVPEGAANVRSQAGRLLPETTRRRRALEKLTRVVSRCALACLTSTGLESRLQNTYCLSRITRVRGFGSIQSNVRRSGTAIFDVAAPAGSRTGLDIRSEG